MSEHANTSAITLTPVEFAAVIGNDTRIKILSFLSDRDAREKTFIIPNAYRRNDPDSLTIIKSHIDDETDFLYAFHDSDIDPYQRKGTPLEYFGLYSYVNNRLYDVNYRMSDILGMAFEKEIISKRFYSAVNERITAIVGDKPVPVDSTEKDAEIKDAEDKRNRENFTDGCAHELAVRHYLDGTTPSLTFATSRMKMTPREYVGYINHPDETVDAYAAKYVKENARSINRQTWENAIIQKHLNQIIVVPGELYAKKRIAESVPKNCKHVIVIASRDGKTVKLRIEAKLLRAKHVDCFDKWYMDAPSLKTFHDAFGNDARLSPDDIASITYGAKVLYEK